MDLFKVQTNDSIQLGSIFYCSVLYADISKMQYPMRHWQHNALCNY